VRNLISGLIQLKPTVVGSIPLNPGKLSSKPSATLIYADEKSTLLFLRDLNHFGSLLGFYMRAA
jgi:hypothetical protein